ncbi:YcjF family protein [Anaerotignum sp.]|uniref:YcjF family protein n=1 Tax=Anaerotignum sp. TaxID=2039241 RepID=UPI0028B0FCA6|nr:GTPase [Anaerotignum sp.]
MERGNVLVIGNSGVGKSTLINAVLGEERAETGWGTKGTTDKLTIYESEKIPFRIIDTIGFEPSFIKELKAINAVKKWSKDSAKEGHEDNQINLIWFCVDGTSSKLFSKTLKDLLSATSMWRSVPVIVIITKSYSVPEREQNIEMVYNAFTKQKRYSKKLRKVIPVVASTYVLNDNAYAAPEGISELVDATNEVLPEGLRAGEIDIAEFKLNRKRAMAHGIAGVSTTAAVVVGAVPIPFADAIILSPIEIALVNALAQIYGVGKNEESKRFFNSIVEVGTVSVAAKSAISGLKAIPGINLGASVVNAIIAGSIVATLGEGTIYAFEQVYLGKKSVADIDWVKEMMESKLSSQFIDIVKTIVDKSTNSTDVKAIANIIEDTFKYSFSVSDSKKV